MVGELVTRHRSSAKVKQQHGEEAGKASMDSLSLGIVALIDLSFDLNIRDILAGNSGKSPNSLSSSLLQAFSV